jgi:hypothetical protein
VDDHVCSAGGVAEAAARVPSADETGDAKAPVGSATCCSSAATTRVRSEMRRSSPRQATVEDDEGDLVAGPSVAVEHRGRQVGDGDPRREVLEV